MVSPPEGTNTEDLTPYKQRSEVDFLYLGKPRNPNRAKDFKFGYALSLDNIVISNPSGLYTANDVGEWKLNKMDKKPSGFSTSIESVITCIKADKTAPSGLIFDIRKALQDKSAYTVAYTVNDQGVYGDD